MACDLFCKLKCTQMNEHRSNTLTIIEYRIHTHTRLDSVEAEKERQRLTAFIKRSKNVYNKHISDMVECVCVLVLLLGMGQEKIKWTMIISACVNFLGVNVSLFDVVFSIFFFFHFVCSFVCSFICGVHNRFCVNFALFLCFSAFLSRSSWFSCSFWLCVSFLLLVVRFGMVIFRPLISFYTYVRASQWACVYECWQVCAG